MQDKQSALCTAFAAFAISAMVLITQNELDISHSMGFSVHDIDIVNICSSEIDRLMHLVSEHGVIVIQNATITPDNLLSFASKFGEPIKLPNGFGFNSSSSTETESFITNITNIDPFTGNAERKNTAEYLHNDGDFWQNNYIYSFLYGDIIPSVGGMTQFVDLQAAHNYLKRYYKEDIFDVIQGERVVSDVNDIPDFKGSPFLAAFNEEHDIAKHEIVSKHAVTQKPVLFYAFKGASIEGFALKESNSILSSIDGILMNNEEMSYKHQWKPRDLVIWDNTRVMHRSMGGYYRNARRLLRVQSHAKSPA